MGASVAGCALLAAALGGAPVSPLSPGVAARALVASAKGVTFRAEAHSGQLLHVIVEQGDLDLRVCLYRPSGQFAAGVDAFDFGPESLSHVADSTGTWRILVLPTGPDSRGAFGIRWDAPRQPLAEDAARIEAEQRATEWKHALPPGQPVVGKEPQDLGLEVLRLWRQLGERSSEARTLIRLADSAFRASRFVEARDWYQQALRVAEPVGDLRSTARCQNSLGACNLMLGATEDATRYLGDAMRSFQALHDSYGAAASAENLGQLLWRCGDLDQSLIYQRRALQEFQTLRRPDALGKALNALGLSYSSIDQRLSLRYLERALEVFHSAGSRVAEAGTLVNLGHVQLMVGDTKRAAAAATRALDLLMATPDPRTSAEAMIVMARALEPRNLSESRRLCQAALERYRQIEDRRGQASALHALGGALAASGEMDTAVEMLENAFRIRMDAGIQESAAASLYEIGRILDERGDLEGASRQLSEAIRIVETLRTNVPGEDFRISYFASKQPYYERYIDLRMRLGDGRDAFNAVERARARALLDSLSADRARIRVDLPAPLLDRRLRLERLLNFKSQQLISMARQASDPSREARLRAEIDESLADYNLLDADIRRQSPRYADLWQATPTTVGQLQGCLGADTALLEFSLGESRSYLWVVTHDALETFVLPGRSKIETAIGPAVRLIGSARERGSNPLLQREFDGALRAASQIMLGHPAAFLTKKRWFIVGDGVLQHVPVSALMIPGERQRVASMHEITILPSASILNPVKSHGAPSAPSKSVAIFADPVFDALDPRVSGSSSKSRTDDANPLVGGAKMRGFGRYFPRLPFSILEVKAVSQLVPPEDLLVSTGFTATKARLLRSDISDYRILHLSTHALLDETDPELSGVVLSQVDRDGKPQDGFLHLYEIYNLQLANTDLAVLSACNTGLGKETRGEGVVGIARGFLSAGAQRVLVSLWEVEDDATAELMQRFYQALLGKRCLPPDGALAAAQRSMMADRRWQDPYYWAAFELVASRD